MTETYSLRNQYWIGNYQMAVHSASSINPVTSSARLERDVFLHRALVAEGKFSDVLDDVADTEDTAPQLRAVRVLAQFYADRSQAESCLERVKALYAKCATADDATCSIVMATIEAERGDIKDALRLCQSDHLELQSFFVSLCLRMHRVDAAAKTVKAMQQKDEEAALTQLSAARVNLFLSAGKQKEAQFTFQELIDRFGHSAVLLNGLGTAHLLQQNYEEAEQAFLDALAKAPNDADTLINLITCSRQSGKPSESADRFLRDLRRAHPEHPYVKELSHLEDEFSRVSAKFSAPAGGGGA